MPKPQIIVLSAKPVFNLDMITPIGSMSNSDTSMLYSVLLMNLKENISNINSDYEVSVFLNNKDQTNIPEDFIFSDFRFFDPSLGYKAISAYLAKKIHAGNTQFIILFANTIGFSPREYQKVINLLNYDDNSLVLGKSPDDRLSLLGLNYFDEILLEKLYELNPEIDTFIRRVNPLDYFLFIHNGYQFINNQDDFRRLYKMLSTKESIEYCSHQMHEQFTHLFIEYKESL